MNQKPGWVTIAFIENWKKHSICIADYINITINKISHRLILVTSTFNLKIWIPDCKLFKHYKTWLLDCMEPLISDIAIPKIYYELK